MGGRTINTYPAQTAFKEYFYVRNGTGSDSTAGYPVCYDTSTAGDGKVVVQPATANLGAFAGVWDKSSVPSGTLDCCWGFVVKGWVTAKVLGHASMTAASSKLSPTNGQNYLVYTPGQGTAGEHVVGVIVENGGYTTTSAASKSVFLY